MPKLVRKLRAPLVFLLEIGTFLTNYTCAVAPGRRGLAMAGAPMPGHGATSARSNPRRGATAGRAVRLPGGRDGLDAVE